MNETAVKHDKLMLSRLQLFRNVNLDEPALDSLLSSCTYRDMVAGEMLLSPDSENRYLYVIISGRLVIHLGPYDDVPLNMVEPGECVGEMSIIDSRVPSAQVSASESARVLELEQEILWRMVSDAHEISRNLLYIMSERVRYSNLIIADTIEMQRKYERFATIDSLTGLHNRGWLDDMFAREIRRSERDELSLCLMMIDVDHFKQYNDGYIHPAGVRVLVSVGKSIRKPLRPNDMVARYGGEEFAVLLPETRLHNARAIAERLRLHVSSAAPGEHDGMKIPAVTVSIGIAEHRPGDSLESLITAADTSMYHAKNDGRNCVRAASKQQAALLV